MSCKHCGGQPGFGKYFPATVRSLAQTTTSQTIVKHIAVKCRLCPPEVRLAVLGLQRDQASKDRAVKDANGSAFESRPRYGSRKIFFQRLWGRLHGGDIPAASEPVVERKARRAVVSPHFDDSLSCPSKFSYRWPSIARHMMKNDDHDHTIKRGILHEGNEFSFSSHGHGEKRSRAISCLDEEGGDGRSSSGSNSCTRRKMSRTVSHC